MVMYLVDFEEEHGYISDGGRRVRSCVGGGRKNKSLHYNTTFLKFLYRIAAEKIFPEATLPFKPLHAL